MNVCPNCGKEASAGELFCTGCGTSFTAPQRPPAPISSPWYAPQPLQMQPINTTGVTVWAVCVMLLGNFVIGLIALIFASEINKSSNPIDARSKYDTVKKLCIAGTVLGVLTFIFVVLYFIFIFSLLSGLFQNIPEFSQEFDFGYYEYTSAAFHALAGLIV